MKLIMCPNCEDVRKLSFAGVACECGETMGRYLDEGSKKAVVSTDAIVIGVPGFDAKSTKVMFKAFIVPRSASTVLRPASGPRLVRVAS